jgi:hypothetical protein
VKFNLRRKGNERGWPGYILWGRVRTSTAGLLAAFILLSWVSQTFQPEPKPPEASQIVPPGFVPDPEYTWVPRTNVQEAPRETRRTYTTTTTASPTPTTTTTTETTPTDPDATTTSSVPTTVVDPDGPGPAGPTTLSDPDGTGPLPPQTAAPSVTTVTPTAVTPTTVSPVPAPIRSGR